MSLVYFNILVIILFRTLCFSTATGCEVVALGTGNYNTSESLAPNGRVVHDSHAVVTARRSLMRSVIFIACSACLFGIIYSICDRLSLVFHWDIWDVFCDVIWLQNYRFYIMVSLSIISMNGFHCGVWGPPGGLRFFCCC